MRTNKPIVALDVDNVQKARELVNALRGVAGMFKIGMQLFTAAGPALVREIIRSGERVFLISSITIFLIRSPWRAWRLHALVFPFLMFMRLAAAK